MGHLAPFLAGGLLTLLAVEHLGSPTDTASRWFSHAVASTEMVLPTQAFPADAAHPSTKGDRLRSVRHVAGPASASPAGGSIVAVEVTGLKDATAVTYRDRDGRVLFQSDPVGKMTVVTKGLRMPEVTVKKGGQPLVQPAAVPASKQPTLEQKLPDGCDSAFSPVASPALANLTGRCVAAIEPPVRVASLAR